MLTIKIITPASQAATDMLEPQLLWLNQRGFRTQVEFANPDPTWTYTAGSAAERARIVASSLTDDTVAAVMSGRGGYGCSDFLPLLPWDRLRSAPEKLVIGFSDISALQSALYTKLGWKSLHAPMPATSLWRKNGEKDVTDSLATINAVCNKSDISVSIPVTAVRSTASAEISGTLFGGCFTVLTNLIGTPYFPKSLAGHILFIEDTGENPARLMRAANQWEQSGVMTGAKAIVVGHLRDMGEAIPDCAPYVYEEFARRFSIPVFKSDQFGHTAPNAPLLNGAAAVIRNHQLTWYYDPKASKGLT